MKVIYDSYDLDGNRVIIPPSNYFEDSRINGAITRQVNFIMIDGGKGKNQTRWIFSEDGYTDIAPEMKKNFEDNGYVIDDTYDSISHHVIKW